MTARVVVVGLGAVTSQGPDAKAFWENVRDGRVAIRKVQHISMEGLRTEIAGEVEKVPQPAHDYRRPDGFADRAYEFALQAAEEATAAAGIDPQAVPPERWGWCWARATRACCPGASGSWPTVRARRPTRCWPPSARRSRSPRRWRGAFDVKGPVLTVDTACAAGANAVGSGRRSDPPGPRGRGHRRRHRRAVGRAGLGVQLPGVAVPAAGGAVLRRPPGALAGRGRGDARAGARRPRGVAGRVAARGDRGLRPLRGRLPPDRPAPARAGARRARSRRPCAPAGADASEVDYVNSHGTGTAKNDPAETNATKVGLGEENAHKVAVSSTKSMVGHLLGAAGAVEAHHHRAGDRHADRAPDRELHRRPTPSATSTTSQRGARPLTIDTAVSNNFAFGGANASLVLRQPGLRGRAAGPAVDESWSPASAR